MVEQMFATQCSHGVAETAVVAPEPFKKGLFIPRRRKPGIEQYLFVAQFLKLTLMQQDGIPVEAAAYHFVLFEQLIQREIPIPFCFGFCLLAPCKIGYLCSKKTECIGNHTP